MYIYVKVTKYQPSYEVIGFLERHCDVAGLTESGIILAYLTRKKRKRGVGHPPMSGWNRQLPKYMEKKEKVRWKETDGDGWTD